MTDGSLRKSKNDPPKWRRRAQERPEDILAAALELFAEKGFAAAKLDEIARRAGVAKSTLYLYFKDKEDLFRAVVTDTIAPNFRAIESAPAEGLDFAEIIRLFLLNFAQLATRAPVGAIAKIVIGESRNFPELAKIWHDQVASPALGTLASMIASAQNRGEVRDGDPRLHAFCLAGPLFMGLLWREVMQPLGGAPIELERLAKQHTENILSGLLAAPPK